MGDASAVTVEGLVKEYPGIRALAGVSFHVARGEIYALLGPNGAGKTTLLTILTGLRAPTAGTVRIAGADPLAHPVEARRHLGWAGQETSVYDDLTARENLALACALAGVPRGGTPGRIAALLETVGLADRARDRVGTFSGGMKRRLHLAMAMVHEPPVLLLDEPLVGIDPQTRAYLLEMIADLAGGGTAVLLTTHDLADAEQLAHRIGILDGGELIAEGTLDELRASVGERDLVTVEGGFDTGRIPELIDGLPVELLASEDGRLVARVPEGTSILPAILQRATAAGIPVHRAMVERPTLETLFLTLTGRELRDR